MENEERRLLKEYFEDGMIIASHSGKKKMSQYEEGYYNAMREAIKDLGLRVEVD
jgi:hypothetical protein